LTFAGATKRQPSALNIKLIEQLINTPLEGRRGPPFDGGKRLRLPGPPTQPEPQTKKKSHRRQLAMKMATGKWKTENGLGRGY